MPVATISRLRFAWSLFRLAFVYLKDGNPYRSKPYRVPMRLYGSGNLAENFQQYLEGESRIPVDDLEDICRWLRKCEYVSDVRLFGHSDYWQHPIGFEELKRGDCEDHALWAWRKLLELGYDAELVVGRHVTAEYGEHHAWVAFARDGEYFVLESVDKSKHGMVLPLERVQHQYIPYASVNGQLERQLYAGFFDWIQRQTAVRGKARGTTLQV